MIGDRDDGSERQEQRVSRREFLASAATGTAVGGVGRAAGTQQVAERFFIGGKVTGWQGLEKGPIDEGIVNPTLNLTAGKRYELTWKNLDGAPHNFVVKSADGKTLVSTSIMSKKGATQTVQFTATEEMDEYLCQVHPSTMHGQVTVARGGLQTTAANQTTRTVETTTKATTRAETTEATTSEAETTTAKGGQRAGGGNVAKGFFIGGKVAGWQALKRGPIKSGTNPTLNLEPGERYEVTWKNLDGAPHNFTIKDAAGNTLAQTKTVSKRGATVSLTFTASKEMATYVCTIHPSTMQGNIAVGGGAGGQQAAAARAAGGKRGGVPIPNLASMVAMLWTAAMGLVVGLSVFVLKYFDDLQEPEE